MTTAATELPSKSGRVAPEGSSSSGRSTDASGVKWSRGQSRRAAAGIKDGKLKSLTADLCTAVELLARHGISTPNEDTLADRMGIVQPHIVASMRGQPKDRLPPHAG